MKVCTLRPSKKYPNRYTKQELIQLVSKKENISEASLRRLTIKELCTRLHLPILDYHKTQSSNETKKTRKTEQTSMQTKHQKISYPKKDDKKIIRILTLCATPQTSDKIKMYDFFLKYLNEIFPDAIIDNHYIGQELKSKRLPKCRADISSKDWIQKCRLSYNYYDVIINEFCPLFLYKDLLCENLRKLLKQDGFLLWVDVKRNRLQQIATTMWKKYNIPVKRVKRQ